MDDQTELTTTATTTVTTTNLRSLVFATIELKLLVLPCAIMVNLKISTREKSENKYFRNEWQYLYIHCSKYLR